MFVLRALQAGLRLARPLSSKESYDYIVDGGRDCVKVQVKTTGTLASKFSYHINCGKGASQKLRYEEGEIDFLAVHVIPEDTFFIFPWAALEGRVGLSIPSTRRIDMGRFQRHHDRWDLLLEKPTRPLGTRARLSSYGGNWLRRSRVKIMV